MIDEPDAADLDQSNEDPPEPTEPTERIGSDHGDRQRLLSAAKRRRDEIFGDELPRRPEGDAGDDGRRDAEILRDVPPHH